MSRIPVNRWSRTLTQAQKERVFAAMDEISGSTYHSTGKRDGFSLYMIPTVGTPTYLELRYRSIEGRLLRCVVIDPTP